MKGNVSKSKGGGGVSVVDGKVIVKDGDREIELMQGYKTYGVTIWSTNSNPETAVEYTDAAVGMTPGSSDWMNTGIFRNIRPCLLKGDKVVGYLNPDNFAQFEDGTAADITSGDSGDVMIEIPRIGYKISSSGNAISVQVTDDPNNTEFCYKAHTLGTEIKNKLYIGAYLSSVTGTDAYSDLMLHSLSGKTPSSITLANARRGAENRIMGSAGDTAQRYIMDFYQLTLLQCLYLIMFKNLDSSQTLGFGRAIDSSDDQGIHNTGTTNTGGMIVKHPNDMGSQIKFLGLEDFYGNLTCWIDGLDSASNTASGSIVISASTGPYFNDSGSYEILFQYGTDSGEVTQGFISETSGNSRGGFLPTRASQLTGSATTYYTDYCKYVKSCYACFGVGVGGANASSKLMYTDGVFGLWIAATNTDTMGARIMYL